MPVFIIAINLTLFPSPLEEGGRASDFYSTILFKHFSFLFNIDQNAEECDATKV